jgi:hypothetical protein
MGSISVSSKILDRYFGYLELLDNEAKMNLITRLKKSIDAKEKSHSNIDSIFGAWEDVRSSNDIIKEIKSSRIEKSNDLSLE